MRHGLIIVVLMMLPSLTTASEPVPSAQHVYAVRGDRELMLYAFSPEGEAQPRPAILIFHGGGWSIGEASWGFAKAEHFAESGLDGISVQYRLSGSEHPGNTPLDAIDDARSAFRWVREHADELGVDVDRVGAYGWSAGAHLIACAAIFNDTCRETRCSPDAMLLASPALSLHHDELMQRLLGDKAKVEDISPDRFVREGLPPTLILQGRTDTVTPLAGNEFFHEAMLAAGNSSKLIVYDDVGHLFTPSTESDSGWPNPDPEVRAKANQEIDAFLVSLGYVNPGLRPKH